MDTTLAGQPAGQLLDGRYQVTSSIAHGGMATVYLGLDTRLDRTVAIKIMHAELAADEHFVARFIREARSVAQLSHPNVVSVYDQGSDGRHLYLAMEYVHGHTLRQLLNEHRRLSPRDALDIIENVLAGLAAAHQAGLVHRDVKPENVLLAADGRIKVADFGLARSITGTSHHTKTGVLMGTVAYLAPEQVTDGASDTRCDVYAAGVMLFELLTGRQPHVGESALAVAYKHVNETIPAPSAVEPGLPQALDALVALATSRDPELRPADAGQFLQAVRAVRQGMPIPGPFPPPMGPAGMEASPAAYVMNEGPPGPLALPGMMPPADYGATPSAGAEYEPQHRTLIVGPDGGPPAPRGGSSLGGRHQGPREPWLQRWLFSRRLVLVLAAVLAVALIGGIAWWQVAGRYAKVPQVTRLSLAAATAELRGTGFTVRTAPPRLDNSVAKGDVIATTPAAGSSVRRGATILLIPSAGPRLIAVPQVSGQALAAAQAALRQAGLTPGTVINQASATIAAGIVISTNPPAGTSWPQPRPVTITVSAGPPLPNFVGQPKSTAEAWAQANGVSLNEQPAQNSTQPQDTITRQSPAPNSPVTKGEVVTIYISPGPPMVQIPNVDGMPVDQAVHTLEQLGFTVNLVGAGPLHAVFNYSPNGQAPKGSTITVFWGLPGGGN
ncbi:MAG TPA: Stk1 family PASTA domain-containing Ser/Thr kinase [Streptosporangiaceae bacterium]|nr:Stk1 family PASTA domain-containing Ser/Thr kinase [Streptosporangiaceae bacterium]